MHYYSLLTNYYQPLLQPLDQLLNKVNGGGKFQIISFIIFSSLWFITSWLLLGLSFFFDDDYACTDYLRKYYCQQYVCAVPPEQRSYRISQHPNSIVFEFYNYMICDNSYTITILQSLLFAGSLLGFFIIPYIADNWGRKLGIRISWAIATLGVLTVALAESPNMVGIGYFFAGFGSNPAITLCFSFINYQCLGETRQRFGVGIQIFLGLGYSLIALVFLTNLGWRNIFFLLLGLLVLTNFLLFYLKYTPSFYIKSHPYRALQILNEIATINNRPLIYQYYFTNIILSDISVTEAGSSVFDLFRYKSIRWVSISAGVVFLAIQMIYYSTSLSLDSAGFNKYINQEIIGVSEMLGYIVAEFLIHRCRRKRSSFWGMGVSSLMCLVLAVLIMFYNEENYTLINWIQTVGLSINRVVLCCFWSIFFVYVAELYPTKVRSLGYGWTSVLGMVGSIMSPYIILVSKNVGINNWIPSTVIGFVAMAFICCLPYTFGLPLRDYIIYREQGYAIENDEYSIEYPLK